MTYLEEYAELIRTGDVVAGYWIKKEIRNLHIVIGLNQIMSYTKLVVQVKLQLILSKI